MVRPWPECLTRSDGLEFIVCTSAAGVILPPMVIFQGAHLNHELTLGEVPGTSYGLSENGWIDQTLFSWG